MSKKDYLEIVNQLEFGRMYQSVLGQLNDLRLVAKESELFSVSPLVEGQLDYSYFYLNNDFLKQRKLRIGVMFHHEQFVLELWLVGQNKQITQSVRQQLKIKDNHPLAIDTVQIYQDDFLSFDAGQRRELSLNLLNQCYDYVKEIMSKMDMTNT